MPSRPSCRLSWTPSSPCRCFASGGIADGGGLAAALALGAQGVSLGTRFVASDEAFIPRDYTERVVASTAEDTFYSELFDLGWPDAPHRALRNKALEEWEAAGRPPSGQRPGEGDIIGTETAPWEVDEIPRYACFMLTPWFEGDSDLAPMWAGESCGLVHDIEPASRIVEDIVQEAEAVIAELTALT